MDVYHVGEFLEGGLLAHQHGDLLNDVGCMGTIGMTAEDHALRGGEELEHAFSLTHRHGLAVGAPESFLADIVDTLLFQLILRWPDTGSLGSGEDGGGHDVEVDTVGLAEDMVHSPDGLHLCRMGQHLTAVGIADGVKPGGVRETRIQGVQDKCFRIDGDGAVGGEGDAKGGEVEISRAGLAARGHEDDVGLNGFHLALFGLEEHFTIGNLLHGTLHVESDALPFHLFAQALGDVAVEGGEALFEVFDDRDLGTVARRTLEDRTVRHDVASEIVLQNEIREAFADGAFVAGVNVQR